VEKAKSSIRLIVYLVDICWLMSNTCTKFCRSFPRYHGLSRAGTTRCIEGYVTLVTRPLWSSVSQLPRIFASHPRLPT